MKNSPQTGGPAADPGRDRAAALATYVALMAEGRYFDAHEALEDVWRARGRDPFLQALIQIAAAYHHAARGNRRGAGRLLATARAHLRRAADVPEGWSKAALFEAIDAAERLLQDPTATGAHDRWPLPFPDPADA
ncbi:MAG: DUF309 domain-containing protein [Hydrogenibacillus schlegelii]|uniref:DUF309 domain-containing protein n=1 Tax=Hydrogenibacillus schlegelii TaxID=1484 RepID=A0A947CZ55_HYDSH|nr:DUF309 domain-containing protein [Hydrogenibacillus schlegelii]MBT9283421.1 DUF309 domain-containing protein [Hydrogenibacillus schlegelii]